MKITLRSPTEKDRANVATLRSLLGEGRRRRESSGHAGKSGSAPDQLRKQDPELTPEEIKKLRNEHDRERRLRAMQDRLEVINELRESGYIVFIRK